MSWSQYGPSLIALVGIPLAAFLTWWREASLRTRQERREDLLLSKRYQEWVSQRWWERKADTYTQIVEALWHLLESAREAEEDAFDHRERDGRNRLRVPHDFVENRASLKKISDIGSFVVSDDAAAALSRFFQTIHAIPDDSEYDEMLEAHLAATRTCLLEVREAAMRDLGVSRDLGPM
ncbi:MAG: hypothetical protein M3R02_11370 [Chloroflexota bacterium]|nr:hypothetical protein [Chloroflexota bacterium]